MIVPSEAMRDTLLGYGVRVALYRVPTGIPIGHFRLPDEAACRVARELPACYAAADVFVFASRTETQGLVLLEAMAAGLPVVAFDRAAAAELIVNGRNGWRRQPAMRKVSSPPAGRRRVR